MASPENGTYSLIDAGAGSKLERIGPYYLVRQAAQAFWLKMRSEKEWRQAHAVHHRSSKGGGHWEFPSKVAESFPINFKGYTFKIKLTGFGHIGLFPEQADNWEWLARQINGEAFDVINLFGYTGGSSLAAAAAGARITHVDASKGVVSWARENFELNGLENHPARWIVEDAGRYISREKRRGSTYQGLILDPPTFGRGAKGETWKIEEHLIPLLEEAKALLNPLRFVLLSCHTPGYTGITLRNILHQVFDLPLVEIELGEMVAPIEGAELLLPSGTYARWAK